MLPSSAKIALVVCLLANMTATAQIIPKAFTLKSHPINETRSFLLTEFYVNRQFVHNSNFKTGGWEGGALFGWELGYMRNVTNHWALGGSTFLGVSEDRAHIGIKPRVRYWLAKNTSVDFAAGPILFTLDDGAESNVGVATHIGINASSWLSFTIAMEYSHFKGVNYPYARPDTPSISVDRTAISGGVRIGAEPGIVVGTVGPIIGLFFAYLFINPIEDSY